jgi:rare lipoprotein A
MRHAPALLRPAWVALIALLFAAGCGAAAVSSGTTPQRGARTFEGRAAYYSDRLVGRPTASGEPYRREALTAAHRTLPFGTRVRVTNLSNGRSVDVRINDRGPFGGGGRIIDLSRRAAEELDMIRAGVVPVEVRVLAEPAGDR